jgi:hypothetical protein
MVSGISVMQLLVLDRLSPVTPLSQLRSLLSLYLIDSDVLLS